MKRACKRFANMILTYVIESAVLFFLWNDSTVGLVRLFPNIPQLNIDGALIFMLMIYLIRPRRVCFFNE